MKQPSEGAATAAAAELRALIREAHEAAQALTDAIRAAHTQVEDYSHHEVQTAMNKYTTDMQAAVDSWAAEARADCQRVVDNLNRAMNQVCTVVEIDMRNRESDPVMRADIVVDLRGRVPALARTDTPEGRAILADARSAIVVGSNARRPPSGARPDGSIS